MAKESFYFTHDYNSRMDEKIKLLIRKHGMQGYGIYWAIIEDLYNNTNVLRTYYDGIAYDLRVEQDVVKSIINDFDLFVINGETFGSLSVERRLNERKEKSIKARESISKRWANNTNVQKSDTNVIRQEYDSNTIKEKKGKEIKEKDIEDRKKEFYNSVAFFAKSYSKELLREFFDYWTEHGEKDKKMRFEKETSFNIERRLNRWQANESKFNNKTSGNEKTNNIYTI
jgi:hypothetical protein